ncbi:hypothetical protein DDE18_09485 [Nocardioides gansuensis]|uniref:Uncharacterized protein n=1 Tax=Nocardioides gansuensis TaxID=2138300 RepID=A0A2T8FA43_9ACTN|nr:hypothetical protein [Nocardioides gansuensis]PVG82598.1 hypothetical protein DDE18_09485 [Nocardioides gansuensis]
MQTARHDNSTATPTYPAHRERDITWRTEVAAQDEFQSLLAKIRSAGGTITRTCPCPDGFLVTYVTCGT